MTNEFQERYMGGRTSGAGDIPNGKGNVSDNFVYDALGRLTHNTLTNTTTSESYTYDYTYVHTGTAGINQLEQSQVTGSGGTLSTSYSYDGLNRVKSYTETNSGQVFTTSYDYDAYNNISKTSYPNGFSVTNEYNNFGYLTEKKEGNTGNTIWQAKEMNGLGQYSEYILGNGIQTNVTYNNFGFPEIISAGNLQNLEMSWNVQNGNLNSRTDHLANFGSGLTESFTPDNLNRLKDVSGASSLSVAYYATGTISYKSDAGDYSAYNANHPDALQGLTNPVGGNISSNTQDITYNAFNKIKTISEGNYNLAVTYGADQQRRKTVLTNQGNTDYIKYFNGNYEKLITNGHTYEINYIDAPTGLCAMYITDNGAGTMYYVYTDHLGSILKLTDVNGTTVAQQSFDAWGRNRNPDNWSYVNIPSVPSWLYRGFTGHEHLSHFGLINMNGRLYDPVVGMMLSPDDIVPDATATNAFNRYNYVLNNPLSYIDPNGMNMHFFDDPGPSYDYEGNLTGGGGDPSYGAGYGYGGVPSAGYYTNQSQAWDLSNGFVDPEYDPWTEQYSLGGQNISFDDVMAYEAGNGNLSSISYNVTDWYENSGPNGSWEYLDTRYTFSLNSPDPQAGANFEGQLLNLNNNGRYGFLQVYEPNMGSWRPLAPNQGIMINRDVNVLTLFTQTGNAFGGLNTTINSNIVRTNYNISGATDYNNWMSVGDMINFRFAQYTTNGVRNVYFSIPSFQPAFGVFINPTRTALPGGGFTINWNTTPMAPPWWRP